MGGAKAVIRGKMIQIASRLKKTQLAEQTELENKIKQLEIEHKTIGAHKILLKLKETRKALGKLLTYKTEGALRFSRQRYYEMGNRASRLLAFQLCKAQANRLVPKIVHPIHKKLVSHPKEIADVIASFYKKLYEEPKLNTLNDKSEAFLTSLNLPSLSEDEALQMTSDITETEIQEAIKKLKNNKSPDGWTPWRIL